MIEKKYTDCLFICLQVKLPAAAVEKKKKIPVINMRNPEGWTKYAEETNKIAEKMKDAVKDHSLNIELV